MYDSTSDDAALVGDRERVLLCISNRRDRTLLGESLAETDLEVVVPDDRESLPAFDICLVDTATYPAIADELARRRDKLGAVMLPVLLVLGRNDSEATARRVAEDIDDVLSVPTAATILQKRVRALLRVKRQSRQLALFRRAMDDASIGITIVDAGGDQELRYVNHAFLDMTGYDRDEVLGRNCRFLQGPETQAEPVRQLRRAVDRKEATAVELRNYRKDGTLFWNHLKISPVYDGETVSHYVGVQQDVTDRVERDQTLERYERIVHAAGDPIYALDDQLRFTIVNNSTVQLSDRTEPALLGSHVSSVFGEQHANRLDAAISHLLDSAELETTLETTVTNTEGQIRRFQTVIGVLPAMEFDGTVCVSRDITSSREREAHLSVLDRVLRHNLRNKLLVVLGQVDAITAGADDEALIQSATAIETAAEELLEFADTARNFDGVVDPQTETAIEPVDVTTAIAHAVEEVTLEYTETDFTTEIPGTVWAMAHDSFGLAMTELVYWAAKSASRVDIDADVDDVESKQVRLVVSHDGRGLEDIERRALNAGTETELRHTNGLGLWFVRWMAVGSGGSFTVNNSSQGTTVELTLPLADTPPGVTTRS